jgi:hypothetical protein
MFYATGRCMTHSVLGHSYDVEDVVQMVRRVLNRRAAMWLQMVRVWTQRGWVVLASGAAHYHANIE